MIIPNTKALRDPSPLCRWDLSRCCCSDNDDRRGHLEDVSTMLGVNASWGYSVVAPETREKQWRRPIPWRRTSKPWRRTINYTDCCNCDCDCDSCSDTVHYECCSNDTDNEEEDDDSSEVTVFAIIAGAHLIASIIGCYCGAYSLLLC